MACSLEYKDKVTWETIQNPYFPEGLSRQLAMNSQIMGGQAKLSEVVERVLQNMPGNSVSKTQPQQKEAPHANT